MRSVIPVWLLLCFAPGFCRGQLDYRSGSLAEEQPQPIYSEDPSDAWNQISFALFAKTLEVKISDAFEAFTNGASDDDIPMMLAQPVRISRQVYQWIESGDRAIDPLYPSFIQDDGIFAVLTDPRYSLLTAALQAALDEKTARGKLQRALMQIDLWAAHDLLEERTYFRRPEEVQLLERRSRVLSLFAKLIRKLALTTGEIEALPRNYEAGAGSNSLPALFEEGRAWIELQWVPGRIHDRSAHYRRAARVFVRPSSPPADVLGFLEQLRR